MNQPMICTACGTQYPQLPFSGVCVICADDRQYVPEGGQTWTTHDELLMKHQVRIKALSDKVYELVIEPNFAIGQRALLVLSDQGNILWDCIALPDEQTIDFIRSKRGLKAIAFSHPHYFSNMNDWAATFDCPIYIHAEDEEWIVDKGERVSLWSGSERALWDGMRLLQIGGHFPGSSILHVPALSAEGAIFSGDTVYVAPSMEYIAVMYSYPNRIPLPVREVERIKKRLEGIAFDTLYGFYSYQNLSKDVKRILKQSLEKYV